MADLQQLVTKQVSSWTKEREKIEHLIQDHKIEAGARASEIRPVITLSRQRGCRGKELAKLLAHDLQYGMMDQSIIDYIADHMGVRSEVVEMLDERDRSELELWFQEIFTGSVFARDDYIKELGEVVKSTSLLGGVVILGRGANYLLQESNIYRVRLVAPLETRIQTLVQQEGKTEKQAREDIERTDKDRQRFAKRYFHKDINDPGDYDMILNMGSHTLDGAVKVIISGLRSQGWTFEKTGGDMRQRRAET